jgi:hypothetical protein
VLLRFVRQEEKGIRVSKRSVTRRVSFLVVAAVGLAFGVSSAAWADTLSPTADASTNSKRPALNRAIDPWMTVCDASVCSLQSGAVFRSFARFNMSALPGGAIVDKAVLRLWVGYVLRPGTIEVVRVVTPWDEHTITEASSPALGSIVTSFAVTSADSLQFIEVDITPLVQQWALEPSSNYGLALLPTGGVNVLFDSKENPLTSHAPEVEVTTNAGSGGPAGPTGPAGPAGLNGLNGLDGAAGATGATGPTGSTGPAGLNGVNGVDGPSGSIGPAGPNGATGASGPAGANGINGGPGPAGATGPIGPTGPAGPSGPAGIATRAAPPCFDNTNRYVNCGNGTVTDTNTGLIWLQNANCLGTGTYSAANQAAAALTAGLCGLTDDSSAGDWRLPTIGEWEAMNVSTKAGSSPFTGVQTSSYWSSSTDELNPSNAWHVDMNTSSLAARPKNDPTRFAWPVRSGR